MERVADTPHLKVLAIVVCCGNLMFLPGLRCCGGRVSDCIPMRLRVQSRGTCGLMDKEDVEECNVSWSKPPARFLKCNIDVAFFSGQNRVMFRMCIRDEYGSFAVARSSWTCTNMSVKGEVTGLLHALEWVTPMGFDKVLSEMDCKGAVDAIRKGGNDVSATGAMVNHCRLWLMQKPNFQFMYVRRQANIVAHASA
ncbi:hypothetical protein PTKIN_Ptkin14bG0110300 [Pterospermum kingtungense]